MKKLLKEIINELILVLKGNTLDLVIPPILFYVSYQLTSIEVSILISISFSIMLFFIRLYKKDPWYYAVGGIVVIFIASAMVYINQNASNFFLPDLIGSAIFIVLIIMSLMIKKPLAAIASHITRGWEFTWFNRDDIYPAYFEVTLFWLFFFIIRFSVELYLYLNSTTEELLLANIIMGIPLLIFVLTVSYLYGLWRLKTLSGPGIDEFRNNKKPPFRGQTTGF